MRSQIKASATKKEQLRSSGATSQIEVSNSGLERLDHLIGRILDHELIQAIDRLQFDFGPTVILTAK